MSLVDIILIQSGFRTRAVVAIGLIDIAFFGADPKRGRFIIREVKRCDGYFACFVVACMNKL